MQQLTRNLFAETEMRGANHGFVVDFRRRGLDRYAAQAERRAETQGGNRPARRRLRYILNTEPHGDHWTGNAFFDAPVVAHEGVRKRILETDMKEHGARVATFGPEEPGLLENYRANAPVITFKDRMTLHVGKHTFEMIHMPGHTAYQAAICMKEEGVVFTSDNIFHKVHTWLQEANPDQWLIALESLRKLDEEVFVPGMGPLRQGLPRRAGSFIQEWKDYVKSAIDRGMNKEEAIER